MAQRVTQVSVQALVQDAGTAQVTQESAQLLVQDTGAAQVTQVSAQALVLSDRLLRVGQLPVEALVAPSNGLIRVGQLPVEVLVKIPTYRDGELLVTGSGALDQVGENTRIGALDVAGSGTLDAAPTLLAAGALSITGTGTLEPSGDVVAGGTDGDLDIAGSGTLDQSGQLAISGALDSTGTSSLALAAELRPGGALAVTGTGTLAPSPSVLVAGALSITGSGSITLSTATQVDGELAIAGSGSVAFDGVQTKDGALAVAGSATLAQGATALLGGRLAFIGSGALSQFARADWSNSWPVEGHGYISFGGELLLPESAVSYHEQQKHLPRVIVIKVNGVDVTDDVRYADATFAAQVNGIPGDCSFAVRDDAHTRAFTSGQSITVHIDGKLMWRGFVRRVKRQYSADVVDTSDPSTVVRWFLIEGSDVNLLLSQRVLYYKPDPGKAELRPPASLRDTKNSGMWREDAPVADVVKYILSHYSDLLDDGVSLDGVTIEGTMNPDNAVTLTAAQTVADFLRMANRWLGGVFYLTYDLRLVFRDVETATTNFYLTDLPSDADSIGPRDYMFTSDASKMANDALVWGTAPGVTTVRFGRAQDAASQADHGRWQTGEFSTQMYKQTSVDARANAMVYGNYQSRHGANVDRLQCEATIFVPLLLLGDVVWCESTVFTQADYDPPFDTTRNTMWAKLPLRRMVISFPTKTSTRFSLGLSQEIDDPWNIYEWVFPKIKVPGGGGTPKPPKPPLPEIKEGDCTDAICGTTDTFSRSVSSGWGMSEAGLPWLDIPQSGEFGNDFSSENPSGQFSVVDGRAQMAYTVEGSGADPVQMLRVDEGLPFPIDVYFESQGIGPYHHDYALQLYFGPTFHWNYDSWLVFSSYKSPSQGVHWFYYTHHDQGGYDWSYTENVQSVQLSGDITAVWCWRIQIDGTGARAKKWVKGTTEPDWQISLTWTVVPPQTHFRNFAWEMQDYAPVGQPQPVTTIDNIDITGVNRCSAVQFDDFNRTVANGWGVATNAVPWSISNGPTSAFWVDGLSGYITKPSGNAQSRYDIYWNDLEMADAPWWSWSTWDHVGPVPTFSFTARIGFRVVSAIPTSGTLFIAFVIGGLDIEAWVANNATGSFRVLGEEVSKSDWVSHQLYEFVITYDAISHDWTVALDGLSLPPDSYLNWSVGDSILGVEVINENTGADRTVAVDYIEFDYARKPCYPGCSADAGAISTTDTMWNQSGPSAILGYPWEGAWAALAYDYAVGEYQADTEVGVSGGLGYLRLNANTVIGSQAHSRLLGTGWNDGVSSFTMTMKFRFTDHIFGGNWTVGVHGTDGSYDRWVLYIDSLWDYWSSGVSPGTVVTDYPFGDMQVGTWYMMKWDYHSVPGPTYPYGGYTRIKVWPASQSEPANWLVDTEGQGGASTPLGPNNYFYISLVSPGDEVQETLEIDYIDFACDPPPSGEASEVPSSGPYCETLTHSGGTHFATAKAWWPGSLVVYVNGVRTLGFTSTVPGEFTLTSAISASDTLRVCYQVNGTA